MFKPFMPLMLCGVLATAGCDRPAPGPARDEPGQNAASNARTSPAKTMEKPESEAVAETPANAQKVTIELPAGYKEKAAAVKAGTPVALTFKLTKDADCGNEISVPVARWQKKLKVGESATLVYTPQKTGELKFACSMDMMQGTLTVH